MDNNTPTPKYRSLSLCVIYGNEAPHIERFIDSFKLIADEFVFVRAIGNQEPDETLFRIEAKAAKEKLNVIYGEYKNTIGEPSQWPHVDRFDKARQMSFDLATCDLRMWADCDDVLPETSIAQIFHLKQNNTEDMFFCKYELPDMDHGLMRERIIARIPARWMSPVHESLVLPPNCSRVVHEGIIIEHRPIEKKQSSVERNLKILEYFVENPDPEDWEPAMHFYLHRDYYYHPNAKENGFLERSVRSALKAITFPLLGQIEKYECLINLSAILAEQPKLVHTAHEIDKTTSTGNDLQDCFVKREKWLLNAFRIDPTRREALAALAVLENDRKAYPRALGYANAMRGIPEPYPAPWTHRRAFYHWKGALILTQCLRYNGKYIQARELEDHVFDKAGRTFSVLHATRRGKKALDAMYFWLSVAANAGSIEWIFAVDEDDTETREALKGYRTVVVPPNKGPVAAWNAAAKEATGKVLIQMSDDWFPPMAWDQMIFERFGDRINDEAVLKISDGHRKDDLMCMAILTKKYYDSYGYVFHPEYFSMYSDNEFTWQAQRDGVIIDASDIVLKHAHPLFNPENYVNGQFDESKMDDTYKRSNAQENYRKGLEIFERHKAKIKKSSFAVL